MFTRWLFLALSVLFVALPAQAQEYEWKILYYDYTQINVLTAGGVVETILLPEEAQGVTQFSGLKHMQLSPDQRYLLFVKGEGNFGEPQMASLQIADLVEQTCCETVEAPEGMVADTITIGPFNPELARSLP